MKMNNYEFNSFLKTANWGWVTGDSDTMFHINRICDNKEDTRNEDELAVASMASAFNRSKMVQSEF